MTNFDQKIMNNGYVIIGNMLISWNTNCKTINELVDSNDCYNQIKKFNFFVTLDNYKEILNGIEFLAYKYKLNSYTYSININVLGDTEIIKDCIDFKNKNNSWKFGVYKNGLLQMTTTCSLCKIRIVPVNKILLFKTGHVETNNRSYKKYLKIQPLDNAFRVSPVMSFFDGKDQREMELYDVFEYENALCIYINRIKDIKFFMLVKYYDNRPFITMGSGISENNLKYIGNLETIKDSGTLSIVDMNSISIIINNKNTIPAIVAALSTLEQIFNIKGEE